MPPTRNARSVGGSAIRADFAVVWMGVISRAAAGGVYRVTGGSCGARILPICGYRVVLQ